MLKKKNPNPSLSDPFIHPSFTDINCCRTSCRLCLCEARDLLKKGVLSKLKLNSWLKGRSCHPASLHRAPSSSVYACLSPPLPLICCVTALVLQHTHTVTFTHRLTCSLYLCLGGAEQREAKLGTPKRRPSCPDHSGRHTGQSWNQDEESSRGGQEAPCTCCEYTPHTSHTQW